MSKIMTWCAGLALAGVVAGCGQSPASAPVPARAAGSWGRAIEVPGLGLLNKGGGLYISEVSCAPAGTCSAGGSYTDRHHHSQGFVVSQIG